MKCDFFAFSIILIYIVLCNICVIGILLEKEMRSKLKRFLNSMANDKCLTNTKKKTKTIHIWFESEAFRSIHYGTIREKKEKKALSKKSQLLFSFEVSTKIKSITWNILFILSVARTKKSKKYWFLSVHPLRLLYWLHLYKLYCYKFSIRFFFAIFHFLFHYICFLFSSSITFFSIWQKISFVHGCAPVLWCIGCQVEEGLVDRHKMWMCMYVYYGGGKERRERGKSVSKSPSIYTLYMFCIILAVDFNSASRAYLIKWLRFRVFLFTLLDDDSNQCLPSICIAISHNTFHHASSISSF